MVPRSPTTLIEVLRSTLTELEHSKEVSPNDGAISELKRSILLTIADLNERQDDLDQAA